MFDTMKVARKIKEARIARNMTQMNLADAMEVSYQAVSNWERGASCPDIGKLEQLCQILQLSIEELLGTETNSRTLNRIINHGEKSAEEEPPVTIQEIRDFAPILPPADVERLVDDNLDQEEEINLSAITELAPFLDSEYLDSLVKRASVKSLRDLTGLAPFLGQKALDDLVMRSDVKEDISEVIALAPFLSKEALDKLAQQIQTIGNLRELTGLAPFLSQETLDKLVMDFDLETNADDVIALAPFLSQKTLQKLAEILIHGGDLNGLKSIAPFL